MVATSIEELRGAISRFRRRRSLVLHVQTIGWGLAAAAILFILSKCSGSNVRVFQKSGFFCFYKGIIERAGSRSR